MVAVTKDKTFQLLFSDSQFFQGSYLLGVEKGFGNRQRIDNEVPLRSVFDIFR